MQTFIISFLIILLSPFLTCAATLTLDQCIERGLEMNPQVKAYQLTIDEAQEGIYEAWGSFLPSLSVDYGYSRLENGASTERDVDYLKQQSNTFTARLSQPLYDGMSGVASLKRARQSRMYQEQQLLFMQQQLAREIRASFYDILRAETLVIKWTESVARLKNQQEIASAWIAQELATRLRLLSVNVELSSATQELISAESAQAIAEAKLREWLALPESEPLLITGNLRQSIALSCDTVDSCLTQALTQRPEIQLAKLNLAMAQQEIRVIRSRSLPRISFDASWVDSRRDYANEKSPLDDRNYYTLGLNLSMRPFQGGRNIFAYRKQKLAIERLGHEQSSRNNSITTEVKTRFQQIQEMDGRLHSAVESVAEAQEAYQFAEQSSKLGVSSLDDLLSAEIRLTRAEINKTNAEHALQLARVNLDYVVGN